MDESSFNMAVRKFLKEVGVTSQREIERVVREAKVEGPELRLRMTLTAENAPLKHALLCQQQKLGLISALKREPLKFSPSRDGLSGSMLPSRNSSRLAWSVERCFAGVGHALASASDFERRCLLWRRQFGADLPKNLFDQ